MRICIALLTAGCLAGAAAADDSKDKDKEKTTAEKLVGKWKLVKSSQGTPEDVTFVVEFGKKGEMILRVEPKDKDAEPVVLKGTYKLDKDKIDYKMDNGTGGQKQEVLKIKTITEDELVVTDPDDIQEDFKRVKEEKKDDKKKPVRD